MKTFSGKYRWAETWIGSKDGLHESLMSEGITSSGRRWALVRVWTEKPRWRDQEGERYVLRIDFSEWYGVYYNHYQELHRKLCDTANSMLKSFPQMRVNGWFNNQSPGWWDNGFGRQMCYTVTVLKYKTLAERLEQVVSSGFDFDSFDMGEVAEEICSALRPTLDFLESVGKPETPEDDF